VEVGYNKSTKNPQHILPVEVDYYGTSLLGRRPVPALYGCHWSLLLCLCLKCTHFRPEGLVSPPRCFHIQECTVVHTFNNLVNRHAHDHHSVAVVNNSSLVFCLSSPHVQGLRARILACPCRRRHSQAVTRVLRGLWWGKTSVVLVETEFMSYRASWSRAEHPCRASV
jgi:hypothetical protein